MPDYEKLYYALFSDLSRIIDILEIVRQNAEARPCKRNGKYL